MMADENDITLEEDDQGILLQKIYLADASLEVPSGPEVFEQEWEPEIDVQIHNAVEEFSQGLNRVSLGVTLTARIGEEVAYLVEVQQCGLFAIQGYDEQTTHAILGSYCPSVLFPYAREAISDLIQRGGFPQLLLQPMDFQALYQQHMEQEAEGDNAPAATRH